MINLFLLFAFASTPKIEIMSYCKNKESTYRNRMICVSYFFTCASEIETNNALYGSKYNLDLCKKNWETR